jgi:hypothetical protein
MPGADKYESIWRECAVYPLICGVEKTDEVIRVVERA